MVMEQSKTYTLPSLKNRKLLLASLSPRRHALLSNLGLDFEVAEAIDVDEAYPDIMPADDVAPYLSKIKAEAYRSLLDEKTVLITADTTVVIGNDVLGKPRDAEEATHMLQRLSGNKHKVITGVTLTDCKKQLSFSVTTEVEFAELSEEEINFYVQNFKPFDKAGAYGIQEWIGCVGVKNINGSFYNVMGLPLHRLFDELKRF